MKKKNKLLENSWAVVPLHLPFDALVLFLTAKYMWNIVRGKWTLKTLWVKNEGCSAGRNVWSIKARLDLAFWPNRVAVRNWNKKLNRGTKFQKASPGKCALDKQIITSVSSLYARHSMLTVSNLSKNSVSSSSRAFGGPNKSSNAVIGRDYYSKN